MLHLCELSNSTRDLIGRRTSWRQEGGNERTVMGLREGRADAV